jgi:pyridoxamine 5'-phosphate oxidase
MDLQDCIKFVTENKLCFLATAEGNQPRVRAMGFWFADDSGFYFQTGDMKSLYHQLKANPKIEVCFYKHEGIIGTTLRVSGEAEIIHDLKLKERVLEERPFLKSYGLTVNHPGLIVFRIAHGRAHFWTMDDNLKPKELICF